MAEDRSASDQIRSMYERLPRVARIGIIVVPILIVFWLLWSMFSSMLRTWEPVATGVQGSQQAEVLKYLRSKQIPFKIEGGTIYVPADMSEETKIELSGEGLQADLLLGLERLDEVGMGDTDKTLDAKTQLALQEELQKALNFLPMIQASQVRLALPEERGFLTASREDTKASIWLTLRPGEELRREQVRGLQVQIAHSIRGLQPDNVSILDQRFNLLSVHLDEETRLVEEQNRIEKDIETKVRKIMEPVVGPNGVKVAASVDLSTVASTTTETRIDTTNPAETNYTMIEQESSEAGGAAGAPGAETNTGETASGGGAAGGGSTSRTEEHRTTDYSKTITQQEKKPGDIERMTVSVWIDLKPQRNETGEETEYVSWGDDNIRDWETRLKSAVGFVDNRDNLTLKEISFEYAHDVQRQIMQQREEQISQRIYNIFDWSDWTSLIKIPLLLVMAFILVWFFVRPVAKIVLAPIIHQIPGRAPAQLPEALPKTVEELEAEIEGQLEEDLELPGKEVKKGTILKKRLTELAKNEPETFSQLIRNWLYE